MNLSDHFTLAEMTTTDARQFPNVPSLAEVENLRYLCINVMEPVRQRFGPWHVTSGYRSPALNTFIGGSTTSMHMKGLACDGVPIGKLVDGMRTEPRWNEIILFLLTSGLPVDQVIYEFGRWLHIGTRAEGRDCRKQALMIFEPGKYEIFNPHDPRVTR